MHKYMCTQIPLRLNTMSEDFKKYVVDFLNGSARCL